MAAHRLQDDLLQEFREEQSFVNEQLRIMDPLAVALRKPAAQRLAAKGLIILGEILCWTAILGCIALVVYLNRLAFTHTTKPHTQSATTDTAIGSLMNQSWFIYSMIGLVVMLLIFLAGTLATIRRKNDILSHAGRDIKVLAGRLLNRKAAINAIDQRHFSELPPLPADAIQVNDVLNPGY